MRLKRLFGAIIGTVLLTLGIVAVNEGVKEKVVNAESATVSISERATTLGWENGVAQGGWKDENNIFTFSHSGGGNNGKYYSSDNTWRFYNGGTAVISCGDDIEITSITSTPSQTFVIAGDKHSASVSLSATVKFSSFTIAYTETVDSPTLSSIAVKTSPSKTAYYENQHFDPTGLIITGTYSDSSTTDIEYSGNEGQFTFTPDTSTALLTSNTAVTIGWGGKTTSQSITVNPDVLNSISISGAMNKLTYFENQAWDPSGLIVTGNYSGQGMVNITNLVAFTYFPASPELMGVGNSQTLSITATLSGISNTTPYEQTVTVNEAPGEISIDYSSYSANVPASGYSEMNWSSNEIEGKIYSLKNNDNQIQFQANTSYIYNTKAISGYISSITIIKAKNDYSELTVFVSDESSITTKPESGGISNNTNWTWSFDTNDHYSYFRIDSTSSGAKYFSNIIIEYQIVATVDPTGITLSNSSPITMDTYGFGRRTLTATVEPFNNNDDTVNWGTTNPSVVTIENGILTPVGVGNAEVFATTGNFVSDIATPDLKDSVSVTVTQAQYKKATFTPTSTTVVSQSDDYLDSGSVTVSSNGLFSTERLLDGIQMTKDKTATFTISGYKGMKITGVDLVMSSNGTAGSGSLDVTVGSTNILSISNNPFENSAWNGAYSANPVDIYKATTEYVVGNDEDITFSFSSSANSLYVHNVAIRYLDYKLESWCQDFLGATIDNVDDWDTIGLDFLDLSYDLQSIAKNSTANNNGTVIEQAAYKYDNLVKSHNTYDNFMERIYTVNYMQGANVLVNGEGVIRLLGLCDDTSYSSLGFEITIAGNTQTWTEDIVSYDRVRATSGTTTIYTASELNASYSKIFGIEFTGFEVGSYTITIRSVLNGNLYSEAKTYSVTISAEHGAVVSLA